MLGDLLERHGGGLLAGIVGSHELPPGRHVLALVVLDHALFVVGQGEQCDFQVLRLGRGGLAKGDQLVAEGRDFALFGLGVELRRLLLCVGELALGVGGPLLEGGDLLVFFLQLALEGRRRLGLALLGSLRNRRLDELVDLFLGVICAHWLLLLG